MKTPEWDKKAAEMLETFAHLDPIEPSEEWQQDLLHKLADTKRVSDTIFSPIPYTAVFLFFILLNSAFVFSLMKKGSPLLQRNPLGRMESYGQYNSRVARLETISQEFLTHSSSNN